MLEKLMGNLAEITLAFSVVIALLLLLTPVLGRRYTAKWRYWVWLLIAIRLIFPLNITISKAPLIVELPQRPIAAGLDQSNLPDPTKPPEDPALTHPNPSQEQLDQYQRELSDYIDKTSPGQQTGPVLTLSQVLGVIWLAGIGALLFWQAFLYIGFRRKIRRWSFPPQADAVRQIFGETKELLEVHQAVRLVICPKVLSPMMTGIFSPTVLLPREDYDENTLRFILRHELVHLKRRDILYKQLMLLAAAVHWFNPLVWLMIREANRDVEISCDDAVVRHMNKEQRRQYAESILSCIQSSMGGMPAFTTHFYGGKNTLKKRFENLFDFRRKKLGAAALAVVLLVVATASGLVGCQTRQQDLSGSGISGNDLSSGSQQSSENHSSGLSSETASESPSETASSRKNTLKIEEMLLNFGAVKYPSESGGDYFRTDVVSLYYLDDTDLSALSPDIYYSWYLSMISKEDLTQEEREKKYASPFGENTGWFIPQEYYEPLVKQYFDVTTEYLRSGSVYLPEEEGYWLGGGGVGLRPVILLHSAQQEGNLLRLYLTFTSDAYPHTPAEYKILTLRLEEDGSYRYLRYETDANPSEEQIAAALPDNTAFSTGQDALYRNSELGVSVSFPDRWKDNYTVSVAEASFMEFEDGTGKILQFFYKEDTAAVLGMITAIPKEAWEIVKNRETPIGVYLGENEQYVFVGEGSWRNPYLDGPDSRLFEQLRILSQDMPDMVTVEE